jgi:hypothetical protein
MLNTTPRTWVAGETVTAALMNTEVRDAVTGLESAWTSYTPTWTAVTTNPTFGDTTLTAAYWRSGKTVHFRYKYLLGASFNQGSGAYSFTLPVTAAAGSVDQPCLFDYFDTSAARHYIGLGTISSTVVTRTRIEAGVTFGSSAPVVLGTGDFWVCSGTYEAA